MNTSIESVDFTIITPVFNGSDWIKETVNSVLMVCENFRYEYLVINDGSTDDTKKVLSEFIGRVEIITQKNQGEAAAVNNGINHANGKYVIVVSADDPMRSPKLLIEAQRILDKDHSVVCVYPDWSVLDSESRIIKDVIVPEYSESILVGRSHCIVGPGGVFRREAALKIRGRNSRFRFTSDYDFWLRLSRLGKFQRIPGLFAFWRQHDNSTSIALRGIEMANERIDVMEQFLQNNPTIPNYLRRQALGYAHFQAALLVYFDRRVPAKRWLGKALLYYPKGATKFELKVMIFILLNPLSHPILTILRRIRKKKN